MDATAFFDGRTPPMLWLIKQWLKAPVAETDEIGNRRMSTTVRVDYLNGVSTPEVEWFEREAAGQRLGLLDLAVCEVLQGLGTDDEATRILRHLQRFEIFQTGELRLAEAAPRNYRLLRSRGKTVRKTIDCLVATFCLEHDHALLHCDRDFDAFEEFLGLHVIQPGRVVAGGP